MASGPSETEPEHHTVGEQVAGPACEDRCPLLCRLLVGAPVERHPQAFEIGSCQRLLQFVEVAAAHGVHGAGGH
jgi:hypothetical protein